MRSDNAIVGMLMVLFLGFVGLSVFTIQQARILDEVRAEVGMFKGKIAEHEAYIRNARKTDLDFQEQINEIVRRLYPSE